MAVEKKRKKYLPLGAFRRVYLKKGKYCFLGIGRMLSRTMGQVMCSHLPGGCEEAYCSRSHEEQNREPSWGTVLLLFVHLGSYIPVTANQFKHPLVNTVLFKKKRKNANKLSQRLDV